MNTGASVEKTYLVFHPTRLEYLKWDLIALFFIVFGLFITFSSFGIIKFSLPIPKGYSIYSIVIPFIGMIFLVIATLLSRIKTYYITNYRIIEKIGIIKINETSIYWEKIAKYTMSQNAIERIFNFGTIHLYSLAGGLEDKGAEIIIKNVPDVHKIGVLLDKLIKKKD